MALIDIRAARREDGAAIADIYAPFVQASAVSLEEEPLSADMMAARLEAAGILYPWLVAEDREGGVIAFAHAAPFRERQAYRFTVETNIHVSPAARRRGIGGLLYAALLDTLEAQGFTQAVADIPLPNDASIRLHEMMGFFRAGAYRSVGWKQGRWRDIGVWQRALATPSEPPPEPRAFAEVGVVRVN